MYDDSDDKERIMVTIIVMIITEEKTMTTMKNIKTEKRILMMK